MENGNQELSVPANGPVLERFDLADDKAVIEALSGKVTQGFTYNVNGKPDLSSAGTFWAVREFAKHGEVLRVTGIPKIERCPFDPDYVIVTMIVQRFFVNPATGKEIALDSAVGNKRMHRKMSKTTYKNGEPDGTELVEDVEFITKCCTKAERNGKKKLIPKDVVAQLISKVLEKKGGAPPPASRPDRGQGRPPQQPPATGSAPPAAGGQTVPGQGVQGQAAAPGAPRAGAPPPAQGAARPATPPAPPVAPPAAPAKPPPPSQEAPDVLKQRFWAVLKQASNTQDDAVARGRLKAVFGADKIGDLSGEFMMAVGPILQGVVTGANRWNGNLIMDVTTGQVVWPANVAGGAPRPAPAAPPAAQPAAPAPKPAGAIAPAGDPAEDSFF